MKIKEGYLLNEVGDTKVVIYVGDDENGLQGIIKLNKMGVFVWQQLEKGCTAEELIKSVTDRYDVDESTAGRDIDAFLNTLRSENILEE